MVVGGRAQQSGAAVKPEAVSTDDHDDRSLASDCDVDLGMPSTSVEQRGLGSGGKKDIQKIKHPRPEGKQPCPRCSSLETKFCYYNNYNVNQPRYFCKACQRYWTAGGTLRNIAPGSGRRKSKAIGKESSGKNALVELAKQHQGVFAAAHATSPTSSHPLSAYASTLNPLLTSADASSVLANGAAAYAQAQQQLLSQSALSSLKLQGMQWNGADLNSLQHLRGLSSQQGLLDSRLVGYDTVTTAAAAAAAAAAQLQSQALQAHAVQGLTGAGVQGLSSASAAQQQAAALQALQAQHGGVSGTQSALQGLVGDGDMPALTGGPGAGPASTGVVDGSSSSLQCVRLDSGVLGMGMGAGGSTQSSGLHVLLGMGMGGSGSAGSPAQPGGGSAQQASNDSSSGGALGGSAGAGAIGEYARPGSGSASPLQQALQHQQLAPGLQQLQQLQQQQQQQLLQLQQQHQQHPPSSSSPPPQMLEQLHRSALLHSSGSAGPQWAASASPSLTGASQAMGLGDMPGMGMGAQPVLDLNTGLQQGGVGAADWLALSGATLTGKASQGGASSASLASLGAGGGGSSNGGGSAAAQALQAQAVQAAAAAGWSGGNQVNPYWSLWPYNNAANYASQYAAAMAAYGNGTR